MKKATKRGDTTSTKRAQRRRYLLDRRARAKGYNSWSQYETEVINDRAEIPDKEKAAAVPL